MSDAEGSFAVLPKRRRRWWRTAIVVLLVVVAVVAVIWRVVDRPYHRSAEAYEEAIRAAAPETTSVVVDASDPRARRTIRESSCSLVVSAPVDPDVWGRIVGAIRDHAPDERSCSFSLLEDLLTPGGVVTRFTADAIADLTTEQIASFVDVTIAHHGSSFASADSPVRVAFDTPEAADLAALADTVSELGASLPSGLDVDARVHTDLAVGVNVAGHSPGILLTVTRESAAEQALRLRALAELEAALPEAQLQVVTDTSVRIDHIAGDNDTELSAAEQKKAETEVRSWLAAHPDLGIFVSVAGRAILPD